MDERTVRPLTKSDLPAMLHLCQSNPQYYAHMGQRLTLEELEDDLTALPPGKTMKDKHFVGVWQQKSLVALLDLVTGYPTEDTAYIGWFMVDARWQGRGLGSRLIGRLLERLAEAGYTRIRLAYVKGNEQSRRFWEKNGFAPTGQEKTMATYTAVVMEKNG